MKPETKRILDLLRSGASVNNIKPDILPTLTRSLDETQNEVLIVQKQPPHILNAKNGTLVLLRLGEMAYKG